MITASDVESREAALEKSYLIKEMTLKDYLELWMVNVLLFVS